MAKLRKRDREVAQGVAHIRASFNNTLITICDPAGNVLCFCSAGQAGFKGSRKGTPFAAQLASEEAAKKAQEMYKMRRIEVNVSGPGAGRDSAIKALQGAGLKVVRLKDRTRLPHNGVRPRKKRRV